MAKINLKSFLRLKNRLAVKSENRHYVFAFLALLMLIVVSALVIWSVAFLVSNFAEAFIETSPPASVEKFDIEGFEQLNLIR